MKRLVSLCVMGAVGCAIVVPALAPSTTLKVVQASEEGDHEAVVHEGALACGIERWWVKTGIDPGARQVNQHHAVSTSIFKLRSLTPPATLPSRSRVRPVEDTVYRETAYLIRYKMEADSDYHLVLADTGGRTMIAEIPSPACVGSNSPFLPQIRYVRRTFTSRFHPTDAWQRVHVAVVVTGVGFFDFLHGQSGVAPNGIELHPVLGIRYGGAPPAPPPPATKKTAPAPPVKGFFVRASVSPNPVSFGQYANLTAHSTPGARCSASVVYSTGRAPVSFNGFAQAVPARGSVSWIWHMESRGTGGTARVSCSYRGQTKSATASFSIG